MLNQIISFEINFIGRLLESSRDEKFRDNIRGVGLTDIQPLCKYNRGIKYLLCAIYLFSKYVWVVPLEDKREITTVNAFQKKISKGR